MPQVRIITWNTQLMPLAALPVASTEAAEQHRAASMLTRLLHPDTAPQLLCLQEVFDEARQVQLANGLTGYWRDPRHASSDLSPEDSGLFFASRFPIIDGSIRFREFNASGPITDSDHFADKGIAGALLRVTNGPLGKQLWVFNTHLHAESRHTRHRQLEEARAFICRALRSTRALERTAAVLCGDLNISEGHGPGGPNAEYLAMMETLGAPRDLFREAHPNPAAEPGYTWDAALNINRVDRSYRKFDDKGHITWARRERLDYVLAFDAVPTPGHDRPRLPLHPVKLSAATVRPLSDKVNDHLSDHFAVQIDFEL
ncbi:MAG: endonuclease/exonuclease/phosphatase family protein [Deltaproteobacteria bacterium]|nr:endonuclease/exonuclease/phosphatase family protein [Deltaproteobacteria bacterium]